MTQGEKAALSDRLKIIRFRFIIAPKLREDTKE